MKIKELLKQRGIMNKDLAIASGLSLSRVSGILGGYVEIGPKTRVSLIRGLSQILPDINVSKLDELNEKND